MCVCVELKDKENYKILALFMRGWAHLLLVGIRHLWVISCREKNAAIFPLLRFSINECFDWNSEDFDKAMVCVCVWEEQACVDHNSIVYHYLYGIKGYL